MSTNTSTTTVFKRRESEARSYCRGFDTVFTSAQGSEMTARDGQTYIDFLAGCSSLNYGHNDPDMKEALIAHLQADGIAHGLDMHTDTKADFLETFENVILRPRNMDHKVMFTGPTGANAVEAAMKIARKVTGRSNIVAFTNGFHGVTQGALAATGNGYHRGGAGLPLNNVTRLPFDGYMGQGTDTADYLEAMLNDPSSGLDAPAAILLETVQGEGGLNAARPEWVQRVARLAKEAGALLIIDDIQAGCGRTGTFFSFEEFGIDPDIVTMAKSVSGFGLPMALVLVKPEHDVMGPAEHNGTFRGNTHAFITARVAIEKFWSDNAFQDDIARRAKIVEKALQEIADMVPGSRLKGRSMMRGVDVGSGELAGDICARAFQNGLIVETSGPNDEVVKILAPLTTPDAQLEAGLSILKDAARDVIGTTKVAAE
ncbi:MULTISPECIES: diaminobutyrate--2-oxoglutarate transaminase [Rhodobacterales]|jgi:diaminobutyrate-2-oxoglutarate transaminase|uniref:diaminobutyrate--2-oxoglutarate transaminase n=1 Tax=Rhodobacterales TaxID=204455 RepID=UPI00237EFA89|nr:diaminobutyrate--2-oxoglutarate transaminase [Phaeobacter gallaeciensis]MDE4139719.1 diaminobutyrate--2-oxoglutarate transaminase [Phaeobacter gallaeciensis]MDE4147223.1 diaminobutyrate--2-oxoglutarate transaminase [Phaeobacter gallaeciensis]MDE4151442.1 diaminobutyrate--2-oxoglutarate transaminase [Phaeobacter gallaeciensis]MDE4227774.1 diaminobutyrate--2-oxoglutarate transaminase [Phaeobacter gallaeciensis]MDE4255906.1 diaminobutyrate--2-oxoglutarate transaminase [Phaeobacter gallaeciensi